MKMIGDGSSKGEEHREFEEGVDSSGTCCHG